MPIDMHKAGQLERMRRKRMKQKKREEVKIKAGNGKKRSVRGFDEVVGAICVW
jgi:hypothetical protein